MPEWSSVAASTDAVLWLSAAAVSELRSAPAPPRSFESYAFGLADLCMSLGDSTELWAGEVLASRFTEPLRALGSPEDSELLAERHSAVLASAVNAFVRPNVQLTYSMECGLGNVLGFTNEALGFVVALETLVDTRIVLSGYQMETECLDALRSAGVSAHDYAALERMLAKPVDEAKRRMMLLHRDPGRYQYFSFEAAEHECVLGRSMYETSTIPEHWIEPCNTLVHKILVPSQFNLDTFTQAGVTTPISVVHEPFDANRFDANRFTQGDEVSVLIDIFVSNLFNLCIFLVIFILIFFCFHTIQRLKWICGQN